MTRGSESKSRGPPPLRVCGRVRDPLKGWARKDGALAGTFGFQYAPVGGAGFGLEFVEVGEAGVAAQVAGGVDDGLDPHRLPVFEVLLDPRVFVEDVDDDAAVVAAVDGGAEGSPGVAADPPAEDDLNVVWAADVKVVGHQRLEEAAGMAGGVEHDRAGDFHLAHRDLPPVPGPLIGRAKRQGEPVQPP